MNEVNRGKLEKNERGSDKKESRKIKTRRIEKTEKKNNKWRSRYTMENRKVRVRHK